MPQPVQLSSRLQALFAKTKLVCFGRYALEVPQEAQLIVGSIGVPSTVDVSKGDMAAIKVRVAADIAKIKRDDATAEIKYNGNGPLDESWQIRYYTDKFAKKYDSLFFRTYVQKRDLTFVYGGAIRDRNDNEESAVARQKTLASNLRVRALDEVPGAPGFCIEHGFIYENSYSDQETANAGLFLPSLPDVTFSVDSNKNAYGDYPPDQYEVMKTELSLLNRIAAAKKDQGMHYPNRTLLREGKRDVQHWHGEESLIRRMGGVHDFEWTLVGTPRDVANPSHLGVAMFTKVEHNTVGAAKSASITDDEAVALWDKLLSGLKFRVKVPGAPEGSYFLDPDKPSTPVTTP